MVKHKTIDATLIILSWGGIVWLAKKTRKILIDKRTPYGGKIDPSDKNPVEAAKRELEKESTVSVFKKDLKEVGMIIFNNLDNEGNWTVWRVYTFLVENWYGIPQTTVEMRDPQPFDVNNLPEAEMPPADPEWLPIVLVGKKIIARFDYGPNQERLLAEGKIMIVENLPETWPEDF